MSSPACYPPAGLLHWAAGLNICALALLIEALVVVLAAGPWRSARGMVRRLPAVAPLGMAVYAFALAQGMGSAYQGFAQQYTADAYYCYSGAGQGGPQAIQDVYAHWQAQVASVAHPLQERAAIVAAVTALFVLAGAALWLYRARRARQRRRLAVRAMEIV